MPRMGRVVAPPAGTVANTSHCKSPVESREPLEGLSHCSGGFQDQPWCSAGSRPRPATVSKALKNSLPFTWSLKKDKKRRKGSQEFSSLQSKHFNSAAAAARLSHRGENKTPEPYFFFIFTFFATARLSADAKSSCGTKRQIFKEVVTQSSAPS